MRKRILAAMLMATCLVLSGCGDSGDSSRSVAGENYGESHDSESDTSSDMEDVDSEEDYTTEEDSKEMDDSGSADSAPAETKGIIAMVSCATTKTCDIQVIGINPDTGSQHIISEFHMERNNADFYLWGNNQCCTMRDRLSADFTKLAINKHITDANEDHAGWIDADGNFYDVTEACGVGAEDDFFNTDPLRHQAIGFKDNMFAFLDLQTETVYYAPIDDVSDSTAIPADEEDIFVYLLTHPPKMRLARLSCRIDEYTYIGDFDEATYNAIYNFGTGTGETYIPEADRHNWSGVLSSDGNTVAFFSGPQNGGAVELYTMPLLGNHPVAVPIESNDDLVVDLPALKTGNPMDPPDLCGIDTFFGSPNYDKHGCCLLEWK